jgi:hypothetical protein
MAWVSVVSDTAGDTASSDLDPENDAFGCGAAKGDYKVRRAPKLMVGYKNELEFL